jgi:6-methylsalicylate decarboxylase
MCEHHTMGVHDASCAAASEFGGGLSRRALLRAGLAGLAAVGTGPALFGPGLIGPALAQGKAPFRIDVHHHLSPPAFIEAVTKAKLANKPMTDWTPTRAIEDMDKAGVAVSMTSITTPALGFLEAATARAAARECNEYATKLRSDSKGRFGVFLALPLPDVDGTLAEIAYGLDTLKADGIAMLTSYGTSWLGDPRFATVFEELNRRKAIVYTHPTSAACCRNLVPDVADTIVEFGTDTTRTIADLVFSGAANKYRDIKFIFSHAGGTMPFLAERFLLAPKLNKSLEARVPEGVEAELKRFYYDTAQATHAAPLAAFLKLVPVSQLMFGSDYPYRTALSNVEGLAAYGFSAADLAAIERGNAVRLMPKFA